MPLTEDSDNAFVPVDGAPIGYCNSRDDQNKPLLKPGYKAASVRFAFEAVKQGKPQSEILKELRRMGTHVSKSNLSKLLRNPIYIGKIVVPADDTEPKTLVEGVHEAIVDEKLFYKVQTLLNDQKRGKNRPKYQSKRKELPLRGLLYCSSCDHKMTGSASRSGNGNRYFYYHCNNCNGERHAAQSVNTTIEAILDDFTFTKEANELYALILTKLLEGESKNLKVKKSGMERPAGKTTSTLG